MKEVIRSGICSATLAGTTSVSGPPADTETDVAKAIHKACDIDIGIEVEGKQPGIARQRRPPGMLLKCRVTNASDRRMLLQPPGQQKPAALMLLETDTQRAHAAQQQPGFER